MAEKIIKVFNIISCSFLAVTLSLFCYCKLNHNIGYIDAESLALQAKNTSTDYTRADIKCLIEKIFNNPLYFYNEREMGRGGECRIIIRTVIMPTKCDIENYAFNLAHEFVHLTHFTANDRYANFMAFKILYESNDPFLMAVANNYAMQDCMGMIQKNYSCWGYINKYFTQSMVYS